MYNLPTVTMNLLVFFGSRDGEVEIVESINRDYYRNNLKLKKLKD